MGDVHDASVDEAGDRVLDDADLYTDTDHQARFKHSTTMRTHMSARWPTSVVVLPAWVSNILRLPCRTTSNGWIQAPIRRVQTSTT